MKKKAKRIRRNEKVMFCYIAFFVLAVLYLGGLFYFSFVYDNRIYPGLTILGENVGGKSRQQALENLTAKIETFKSEKIILTGKEQYPLDPTDIELAFDPAKTVQQAYEFGRDNNYHPFKYYDREIAPVVSLNEAKLAQRLLKIQESENTPVQNAGISFQKNEIVLVPEQRGTRLLTAESRERILIGLASLQSEIQLVMKEIAPSITESDIEQVEDEARLILERGLIFVDGEKEYPVEKKDLAGFINFEKNNTSRPTLLARIFDFAQGNSQLFLKANEVAITKWGTALSLKINTVPQNLVLDFSNGQMLIKKPSVSGRELDVSALSGQVKEAFESHRGKATVTIRKTKPAVSEDNLSELGLKTLISRGYSSFAGSPANRVHNVKMGSSKFNGVLIKPREQFSFNTALGPVEAYTGYLPELVILQNKTVPQYGGGLCQVSSTAFRAALNAGLPILARTNHAYPVQYYLPYGVDATIYLPEPDLIFENDTPGNIYIQTYTVGTQLYFDFYGTKREGSIRFAGDQTGTWGVSEIVEKVGPAISDQGLRGSGSFTAAFWRFLYDRSGKLVDSTSWVSKYDSPFKYPH